MFGCLRSWFYYFALAASGLSSFQPARAQTITNQSLFNDYLLAPLRVHLLTAQHSPDIQTTLTDSDIYRILAKLNRVWSQAGMHFYVESIVCEESTHQELFNQPDTRANQSVLLALRPPATASTNLFNIYYIKKMPVNGIYFPEAIFVKDTASLRPVVGGLDEPLPRVTSHELGHAFGLAHRQDTTNLMASGTTGTWLNEEEIRQVRLTARTFPWIEPAPDIMKKANALFRAGRVSEAARLYSRLATIDSKDSKVQLAKKRAAQPPGSRSANGR